MPKKIVTSAFGITTDFRSASAAGIELQNWVQIQVDQSQATDFDLTTHLAQQKAVEHAGTTHYDNALVAVLTLVVPGPESLVTPGPESQS